eukprot:107645_1
MKRARSEDESYEGQVDMSDCVFLNTEQLKTRRMLIIENLVASSMGKIAKYINGANDVFRKHVNVCMKCILDDGSAISRQNSGLTAMAEAMKLKLEEHGYNVVCSKLTCEHDNIESGVFVNCVLTFPHLLIKWG